MFTGLTLGLGEIISRRPQSGEYELIVTSSFKWETPLVIGESISVSGVCLTVTAISDPQTFKAHASAETISRSTLATVKEVNLERALSFGGRLGGHLVSGHVDAKGHLISKTKAGQSLILTFEAPFALMPFILPKGSICIDGVSLTVNEVDAQTFNINLIPQSALVTTLGHKKIGEDVNLETDLIGKYIHRFLNFQKAGEKETKGLSLAQLAENGFM